MKSGGSFIKRLSQIFPWSKSSTLISHDRKIVSSKERTVLDSLGFYQNDNEIGRGSTSIVLSGYSKKSGKEVAIKIYDKARVLKKGKSSHYDKFIKRELRITAQVSHPYIVKCVAGASTPNRVYIIMEKLSGRTVRDEVNRHFRLPEPVVGIWITQLAKAIDYLHNEVLLIMNKHYLRFYYEIYLLIFRELRIETLNAQIYFLIKTIHSNYQISV